MRSNGEDDVEESLWAARGLRQSEAITGSRSGSATHFSNVLNVTFGSVAARSYTVTSSTSLRVAPFQTAGVVDVTVTTPYGTSATSSADQFTALAVPTVTALDTTTGAAGGTSVTITGTNFIGLLAVWFGSVPASAITVDCSTQLTVTTPAALAAAVDVTVTNAYGTSATSTHTHVGGRMAERSPAVTSQSPWEGSWFLCKLLCKSVTPPFRPSVLEKLPPAGARAFKITTSAGRPFCHDGRKIWRNTPLATRGRCPS
jgi:hypothetical protein